MSGPKQYEDAQRRNAIEAVHIAMRQLREHGWDVITITCNRVDGEGNNMAYELEYEPDEDDEEGEKA